TPRSLRAPASRKSATTLAARSPSSSGASASASLRQAPPPPRRRRSRLRRETRDLAPHVNQIARGPRREPGILPLGAGRSSWHGERCASYWNGGHGGLAIPAGNRADGVPADGEQWAHRSAGADRWRGWRDKRQSGYPRMLVVIVVRPRCPPAL